MPHRLIEVKLFAVLISLFVFLLNATLLNVQKSNEAFFLRALLESPYDAVFILDEDGRFEYVNPAFSTIFGWSREDILGEGLMKIFPSGWHGLVLDRWNEALHGVGGQYEVEILNRGGEMRTVVLSLWCIPVGDTRKIAVTAKDFTAERLVGNQLEARRLQLENKVQQRTAALVEVNARLSHSEAALARAQATARMGSWEWNMSCRRPEWSLGMFRLHGLDPEKGVPPVEELWIYVHPADRADVEKKIRDVLEKGGSFRTEYRIVKADGLVIDVLATTHVDPVIPGRTRRMLGTLQDITERRCLERKIVETSRQEQQRIGRDIHDSLGQELAGLALMAKAMENQIYKIDPKLSLRVADISRIAGMAAARARDIAHGLSPVDVGAEALASELRHMTERVRTLYELECTFSVVGDDRVYDNVVSTHLFYIVQEAVMNAIKHASPSAISVEMRNGEEGAVRVADNGKGIQLQLSENEKNSGIGLRIMRHRAEIIGASLSISSPPGGGTVVTCIFPNAAPSEVSPG